MSLSEQPAERHSSVKINTEATMAASGPSKAQNEAISEPTADEIEALRTLHPEAGISPPPVTNKRRRLERKVCPNPTQNP